MSEPDIGVTAAIASYLESGDDPKPARAKKCKRHEHDYQLVKGGKRQVCTACGDAFPCRHACDHLDCRDARIDAETKPNWWEAY